MQCPAGQAHYFLHSATPYTVTFACPDKIMAAHSFIERKMTKHSTKKRPAKKQAATSPSPKKHLQRSHLHGLPENVFGLQPEDAPPFPGPHNKEEANAPHNIAPQDLSAITGFADEDEEHDFLQWGGLGANAGFDNTLPVAEDAYAPEQTPEARYDQGYDHSQEDLEGLLLALLTKTNKPLQFDSILRMAHLPRRSKKRAEAALYALQDKGLLLRAKGAWVSAGRLKHVQGTLVLPKNGPAIVTPAGGVPVAVSPAHMGPALPGDTVRVLLFPGKRSGLAEGRVAAVVERANQPLMLIARRPEAEGKWLCTPQNNRVPSLFMVATEGLKRPVQEGDMLLALPLGMEGPNLWQAKATANLENEESPAAQERLGKLNHGVPGPFPPQVLAEAARLPKAPTPPEWQHRRDMRDVPFVTIDGETAKDFDDAIYVEALPGANQFRLFVAIADVAHYVTPGSALDTEARLRGNSYYFPLSVEPMLPEALSNGLCSLRPNTPRLAMVAEMVFSGGTPKSATFYEAVIQSHARLTYTQVFQGILEHNAPEREVLAPFIPMLEHGFTLAAALHEARTTRGSLDFALPEPTVQFNEAGAIIGIVPAQQNKAHNLIEECMVAANEAVARHLEKKGIPLLYRGHPAPSQDKLTALMAFLQQAGPFTSVAALGGRGKGTTLRPPTPKQLQAIMAETAATPQAATIHRVILRAMMQARYTPENEGHYGLASTCYCHFTSPIRRYADLLIHRALKFSLGVSSTTPPNEDELYRIADIINTTERTAVDAEREVFRRLAALFLQTKVGETFSGVVSGVTDFGLFVELLPFHTEGLAPLSTFMDDYYELWPERQELRGIRTGNRFVLGQPVTVRLEDVNIARMEVRLKVLYEGSDGSGVGPGGKPFGPARRGHSGKKDNPRGRTDRTAPGKKKAKGTAAKRGGSPRGDAPKAPSRKRGR